MAPQEVQALAALGLSITPHSDPSYGWGYTWQGRDWAGPFTTPGAAIHAAFTEARQAMQFRSKYSWTEFAQPGEFWRNDGGSQGWVHIGGPDTEPEEREAFTALTTLLAALNDLRSTETSDLPIPGPAERWHTSLTAGEQAIGELEELMQGWQEELGDQYHRGVNANEALDDDYEESEEDLDVEEEE